MSHAARHPSCLAIVLLLLPWTLAGAQEEVRRFYGYAHHLDGGHYAFTEVQEHRIVDGRWMGGTTTYYLPDGRRIGHKALDFTDDDYVPVFQLKLASGYTESVDASGDPVKMSRGRGERIERGSVRREGLMAADAGLPRLLRDHFATLLAGQTLQFRIAAPARLEAYRFRARRIDDTTFEGKPALRVRVELDTLLKLFSGPLLFTYEPGSLRLLEFSGLTNVHDPDTGKAFSVRITYGAAPPPDAPKLPPLISTMKPA